MKKFLSLALIMLMILPTLVACGDPQPDAPTTSDVSSSGNGITGDNTGENTGSDTKTGGVTFTRGETTDYVVIIGKNASEAEKTAAEKLVRAFEQYLDIRLEQRIDLINAAAGYVEQPHELVVGATTRDMTDLWSSAEHRNGDYFVGVRGEKLYLVGASDTATNAAVSAFIRTYLKAGMQQLSLSSADNICFEADYSLAHLTLNGRELGPLTLGAAAYTTFAKLSLRKLADNISQSYGYTAAVKATSSVDLLLATLDERPELITLLGDRSAVLGALDGRAYLVGRSAGELYAAAAALCRDLPTLGSLELRDGEAAYVYQPGDSIRVMSFNLLGSTDMAARTEAVTWVIAESYPDVLGIQEGKDEWLSYFDTNLSAIYAMVGEGTHEAGYTETYNSIYYRRDRFELLEDGTLWLSDTPEVAGSKLAESKRVRIATWARLHDRLSGAEVLFVNTHLDNASATARSGQAEILLSFLSGYDCQKVVTGDFNSNMSSSIYKKMTSMLLDARAEAADVLPDVTYNALGEKSGSVLDYVYLSRGARIDRYEVFSALYGGVRYPSDHNAVIVDFAAAAGG